MIRYFLLVFVCAFLLSSAFASTKANEESEIVLNLRKREVKTDKIYSHHSSDTSAVIFDLTNETVREPDSSDLFIRVKKRKTLTNTPQSSATNILLSDPDTRTLIMEALQTDDISRLERIKSKNANFTILSPKDKTKHSFPIHFTINHKLLVSTLFIIENMTFDPNVVDYSGHSPLSLTLLLGLFDIFSRLLRVPSIDLKTKLFGQSDMELIHYIAYVPTLNQDLLNELTKVFSSSSNNNGNCSDFFIPLHYAIQQNNFNYMQWIYKNFYTKSQSQDFSIFNLLSLKRYDLIPLFASWGMKVDCLNTTGQNIFHFGCEIGDKVIIETIFNSNNLLDPSEIDSLLSSWDSKGNHPIHYAVINNHIQVLESLLQYSYDIDAETAEGSHVLDLIFEHDRFEMLLLCFNLAFKHNHLQLFKEVITSSQDSDVLYSYDSNSHNLLHHCVFNNGLAKIEYLVKELEFDCNRMDNFQSEFSTCSPLAYAVYGAKLEIIRFLVREADACKDEMVDLRLFSENREEVLRAQLRDRSENTILTLRDFYRYNCDDDDDEF